MKCFDSFAAVAKDRALLRPPRTRSSPAEESRLTGAAFSLLELLVASAVSMLLVGVLLMATHGVSTNYTRTQANITRQGDAAFALDQIVQDIEGYVIPNFPGGEALKMTPEVVGDATNAAWLTILSTVTDEDNSATPFTGATRAISYRLARQNTIDGTDIAQTYAIYRSIASAKHTFSNVDSTTTNMQTQYWGAPAPDPAPTPAAPTAIGNFLSENVVGLSVRFLRRDGTWTSPGDEVRIGRDGTTVNGEAVAGGFTRAEVGITVISSDAAQRVNDGVLTLNNAILNHGKTSLRQTAFFQTK